MHKNFAKYAGIMLILLATYYAPNYAGIIGASLAGNLTTRQIFGRGNVQTHEISNVLGNVTPCGIYSIQIYSSIDIVNSTLTFPVHFHADFWSGKITFFPCVNNAP